MCPVGEWHAISQPAVTYEESLMFAPRQCWILTCSRGDGPCISLSLLQESHHAHRGVKDGFALIATMFVEDR